MNNTTSYKESTIKQNSWKKEIHGTDTWCVSVDENPELVLSKRVFIKDLFIHK